MTKLIQTIAKHELIALTPELVDYATELGLGDLNTGVVRALRYAQEEQLHTLGRLAWWVREEWSNEAD